MKELERLIGEIIRLVTEGCQLGRPYYVNTVKNTILKMFEERDKKIAELELEVSYMDDLTRAKMEAEKKWVELEAQVEKMKCCGNCGEANGIYDCRMKPIEFYKCESWISRS